MRNIQNRITFMLVPLFLVVHNLYSHFMKVGFVPPDEGGGGGTATADPIADADAVIKKLDGIMKKTEDRATDLEKQITKNGNDVKTVDESLKELTEKTDQALQEFSDFKSAAGEVQTLDSSDRAIYKQIGGELAYGISTGTSEKMKGYWDDMQLKKQVDPDSAIMKSMDPKSNAGGIILQETVREKIDSVQTVYGVIRDTVMPTPMGGNELVYFGEKERVNPDVNQNIVGGCCGVCPAVEDLEGWVESRISATKFTRYVCVPIEMVEDANFDIIGRYVVRVIGEKFRFIEDQMGFATMIQNPSLVQHLISGPDFSDLSWDDIIKVPYLNEVLGENSRVWINRTNLASLMLEKGTDGHYLAQALAFSLGRRLNAGGNDFNSIFGEANILPNASASAPDTKFAIYGDPNALLEWGMASERRLRITDQHNWPCDVVTVGMTARYAFGVPDSNSSRVGVAFKTTA